MSSSVRRGYTLIEMLIASVLVGSLMAVCFGLMSMYSQFLTAGQTLATEQQLIRSVVQMLENDLENAVAADSMVRIRFQTGAMDRQAPDISSGSDESSALSEQIMPGSEVPGSSRAEHSVVTDLLPDQPVASAPGVVSLDGTSTAIRVSVFRSSATAAPVSRAEGWAEQNSAAGFTPDIQGSITVPEEGTAPRVDESQTIVWQYHPWGQPADGSQQLRPGLCRIQVGTQDFQAAVRASDTLLESPGTADSVSVSQTTLDALLFPATRGETSESAAAGMPTAGSEAVASGRPHSEPLIDVIPEVTDCRFEYFSGSEWESSWSSEQRSSLPIAVRVRLRLISPENVATLQSQIGMTGTSGEGPEATLGFPRRNEIRTAPPAITRDAGGATTLPLIPVRDLQRIILLQPIRGAMPLPGDQDLPPDAPSIPSFPSQVRWNPESFLGGDCG